MAKKVEIEKAGLEEGAKKEGSSPKAPPEALARFAGEGTAYWDQYLRASGKAKEFAKRIKKKPCDSDIRKD